MSCFPSSSQYLNRASSCWSPQGCKWWAPHYNCISVSLLSKACGIFGNFFDKHCYSNCLVKLLWIWLIVVPPHVLTHLMWICSSACRVLIAHPNGPSKAAGLFPWCRGWSLKQLLPWLLMLWPMPQPIRTHLFCCQLRRETKKVDQNHFVFT